MERSNTALIIIGIIAIAGFSLSGYLFVSNGNVVPFYNRNTVIGFWNNLQKNTDFSPYDENYRFQIQFLEQEIINNDYIQLSNSNTTFSLLKPGLYKISSSIELYGIDDGNSYYVILIENTTEKEILFYHHAPADSSWYFHIISTIYVLADATSEYRIQLISKTGDSFSIFNESAAYNQILFEYVSP